MGRTYLAATRLHKYKVRTDRPRQSEKEEPDQCIGRAERARRNRSVLSQPARGESLRRFVCWLAGEKNTELEKNREAGSDLFHFCPRRHEPHRFEARNT